MKKFRRYMSIAVLIVVAVGAVLLLTPIGERPLAAVFAVGDVETVDFAGACALGRTELVPDVSARPLRRRPARRQPAVRRPRRPQWTQISGVFVIEPDRKSVV